MSWSWSWSWASDIGAPKVNINSNTLIFKKCLFNFHNVCLIFTSTEEIEDKPPPDYQNVGRILGVTRIVGNSLAEYCPDRILLVALGRSTEWPDWNANQPHGVHLM